MTTATQNAGRFETRDGSHVVITTHGDGTPLYRSRLYVNNGETATSIAASHYTLDGAVRWITRTLNDAK